MVNPLAELTLRGWLMTGRVQPPGKLISRLGGNRFFCPKKEISDAFSVQIYIFVLFFLAKLESTIVWGQIGSFETFVAVLFQEKVIVRHEKPRVQLMHDLFTFMRKNFRFAQREWNRRWKGQGVFVLCTSFSPSHRAGNISPAPAPAQ